MRRLKGWLVSNRFLVTQDKFVELNQRILDASIRRGIDLTLITNDRLLIQTDSNQIDFTYKGTPDFILFLDKDVRLAQALELRGYRLFNSARAIEICDDKSLTALHLAGSGIKMPRTIIGPKTFEGVGYTNLDFLDEVVSRLGVPLIVKECFGSFGRQVYLATDRSMLEELVAKTSNALVFQEFISSSCGKDIRINVVGGEIVASMLRTNKDDFRANITNGAKMENYKPTEQEGEMALKVCKILEVDFAGVDLLIGEDGPLLCEVNSNAHIENIFKCTGVDISEKIFDFIEKEVVV